MPVPTYCVVYQCNACGHEHREYGAGDCLYKKPCGHCHSNNTDIRFESRPKDLKGMIKDVLMGRSRYWR